MKIVHWAPFSPFRCGLYEAARDCVRSDTLLGHEVLFCDTGLVARDGGEREEPRVGALDPRGGWPLVTSDWREALDADLWICHDGVSDSYLAKCQAPLLWMVHGRPSACFRPEQRSPSRNGYSLIPELASWPRVKGLVTFWREHLPYWANVVPEEKLFCTEDPPLDQDRYRSSGKVYEIPKEKRGEFNVLLCDSWREDEDIFEVFNACILASRSLPGLKVHIWGAEEDLLKASCWQQLLAGADRAGCLGEIHARKESICEGYRAMDLLVTPHAIATRCLMEAMACGTPVVAGDGCRYTPFTGRSRDLESFAEAIKEALETPRPSMAEFPLERFSLRIFGGRMQDIYDTALGREAVHANLG